MSPIAKVHYGYCYAVALINKLDMVEAKLLRKSH